MEQDIWVRSKWTAEQLAHHSVEYRFPRTGGGIVHGQGKFSVKATEAGLSIVIEESFADTVPRPHLHLSQNEADAIKPAPPHLGLQFICYA